MRKVPPAKNLLLKYEVLRARLDIRDFFFKYAVQQLYENIGQVLSLVKTQLSVLEISGKISPDEKAASPSMLLGQSIRDLRAMSKSFYPDRDIASEEGFIKALQAMLTILLGDTTNKVIVTGLRKEIQSELILIIFKMIKEILTTLMDLETVPVEMIMSYGDKDVKFIIGYRDEEISWISETAERGAGADLTLHQRAELIKGRLDAAKSKTGTNQIILKLPYKTGLYE